MYPAIALSHIQITTFTHPMKTSLILIIHYSPREELPLSHMCLNLTPIIIITTILTMLYRGLLPLKCHCHPELLQILGQLSLHLTPETNTTERPRGSWGGRESPQNSMVTSIFLIIYNNSRLCRSGIDGPLKRWASSWQCPLRGRPLKF